ncbi:hypothetical protein DQ04_04711000 [Trypanosoma grayi]|uniref:hypothetical protein n=1 Tax=Trypanosoma grayi TaxID=71804 RepID=UPI0004F40782|nr:hypothetical protein DQ04_04711000 [Trypanosoma grayi]KEG09747.1 hypothetical protein DQ04_04711000 [Trypanosoma grayi]
MARWPVALRHLHVGCEQHVRAAAVGVQQVPGPLAPLLALLQHQLQVVGVEALYNHQVLYKETVGVPRPAAFKPLVAAQQVVDVLVE